jgi:hypothetical protein
MGKSVLRQRLIRERARKGKKANQKGERRESYRINWDL